MSHKIPVIGFVAWSGTGKTTLISKILSIFRAQGIRSGVIKHTHHNVEFDTPGKDSYQLRKSGANQMMVTSAKRWAIYGDKINNSEPLDIDTEVSRLNTAKLDIVLVESFKTAPIPKIELHRPSMGVSLLFPNDANIVAIATDAPLSTSDCPTQLDLNAPETIASYIMANYLNNRRIPN